MANSGTSCVPHPHSCVCWLKHKWVVLVEKKKVLCCEEIRVRTVRWEWCLEEKIS